MNASDLFNMESFIENSKVKARAVLCPLTGKGQPITMSYRTLSIGTGKYLFYRTIYLKDPYVRSDE